MELVKSFDCVITVAVFFNFQGICISISGVAHTMTMGSREETDPQGNTTTHPMEMTGDEEYFKINYYLMGSQNGRPMDMIVTQPYAYPFAVSIPPNLPASYNGKYGYVRYEVVVTIENYSQKYEVFKWPLLVEVPVDLNRLDESIRRPAKMEMERSFGCLCCASGPLYVIVDIPSKCYLPGQTIPIQIECDNASNVEVTKIKIKFRSKYVFVVTVPHQTTEEEEKDIQVVELGKVEPHATKNFTAEIKIPHDLRPSNLDTCGIISLSYDMHVQVMVSGIHFDLSDRFPLTIGSPLANMVNGAFNEGQIGMTAAPMQQSGNMGWNMNAPVINQPYPGMREFN